MSGQEGRVRGGLSHVGESDVQGEGVGGSHVSLMRVLLMRRRVRTHVAVQRAAHAPEEPRARQIEHLLELASRRQDADALRIGNEEPALGKSDAARLHELTRKCALLAYVALEACIGLTARSEWQGCLVGTYMTRSETCGRTPFFPGKAVYYAGRQAGRRARTALFGEGRDAVIACESVLHTRSRRGHVIRGRMPRGNSSVVTSAVDRVKRSSSLQLEASSRVRRR